MIYTNNITSAVIGRRPKEKVSLWTFQTVDVWNKLLKSKVVQTDASFIEPEFIVAYDWMKEQMKLRLKNFRGAYPWWAYEERPKTHYYINEEGLYVLLHLKMRQEDFLLSSYAKWISVLNFRCNKDIQMSEENLELMFDVEALRETDTIQATFEFLRLEDVYSYTLFETSNQP